jgi:acyl-CoA reductase-like NAD-dependent aldehyde dehydrogenase
MFRQSLRRAFLRCVIILAGCAPRPASMSPDAAAMSARKLAISQQFQKDWERCVDASYKVIQQQTADKNAAAERAFASCATEEDQMNSVYDPAINAMVMPHFKAEAKRLLVEKGHLSTSP